MSDQPPASDTTRDVPGDDLLFDDEDLQVADSFSTPDVHAVTAFVLACISMFGAGLFNGSLYFYQSISADASLHNRNVWAALLGAAFALIPVVLGWRASARVLESDPRWVPTLARAAVIIALLSAFLRLVLAVLAAGADDPTRNFGSY